MYGDGDTIMTRKSENLWHAYQKAGTYQAELYVENSVSGCTDTTIKQVVVHPNPVADFTYNEKELIYSRPIKFFDLSTGGIKWLWSFGDGDSVLIVDPMNRDPEHTYHGIFETTVTQIVTNEFGCSDTISKKLDLKPYLILPTAFSPNGDGANDGLKLHYKGIEELLEFKVYNRWGELIFDAGHDLHAVWDGTYRSADQPVGAYVYYVKARTYTQEILSGSGQVTLIR